MANQRWTSEHERDWRGASEFRDRDRPARDERQFIEGHNPAGPAQNFGGREDRSWSAGERGDRFHDYGARGYGDGGPTGYLGETYQGDARRFDQGGRDRESQRGPRGQDYGYDQTNRYYGAEWSDRDSYDARRADYGGDRQAGHRSDNRGGGYGEYGRRQAYGRDTGGRDTGFGDPNPYVRSATDGETQGHHRGRGPADYRRSDDRIREDVNDRLTDDAHIDASGIQVAVKDGEVTLSGTVDSRFAKRHAEDLADGISGAKHVQNNLRVQDGSSRSTTATADSTATAGSTTSGRA